MTKFAGKLAELVPEKKTMDARIEYVRTHPEKMEAFEEEFKKGFSETIKPAIRDFFAGGDVYKKYQSFKKTLPSPQDSAAAFKKRVAVREAATMQQTAALRRRAEVVKEDLAVADPARARAGVVEEQFSEILRQSGESAFGTKIHSTFAKYRGADLPAYRKQLHIRKIELEGKSKSQGLADKMFGWNPLHSSARTPTPEDRQSAAAIGRLLDKMDALIASNHEANAGTLQAAEAMQESTEQQAQPRAPATSHTDSQ